ncbi:alpha-galactosidase/alpha-n-acetylgalactosaminidase [Striga asiatica]|uniref:alpha-galactosidase n=1 Tax=Striga asiatica TaxID=4170 RepID=A0A5A7R8M5_STRAF|nr:alpha-galactosidase/alpha-n-acetylgalactosaminidase [Striga asiatica]
MRASPLSSLFLVFLAIFISKSFGALETEIAANTPPRGWNSYDSFSWIISEKQFIRNANLVARRLKQHGYEYVVVDFLWYRKKVKGANTNSFGFDVIDEWGRMVPDPQRWPSSNGGKGFGKVAQKVHSMGLKFGIHVMRGISTQAFYANTPILDITTGKAYEENGRKWYAKDIGLKERTCAWMNNGFMSVNTKLGAGRAFLRSLYHQYVEWGVDFVKHDCVFGRDMDLDEITYVSKVLEGFNRTILYSISPGEKANPAMARQVSELVNMYRITGDDWDSWPALISHFSITRDFAAANMIGGKGLRGKSWPDSDMLPLGWLGKEGANTGPYRKSNLTLGEQRIQFRHISSPQLNNQTEAKLTVPLTLDLTDCENIAAINGWFVAKTNSGFEQVCWNKTSSHGKNEPFCLYKTKPRLLIEDDVIYKRDYNGKVHLLKTQTKEVCLGGSPNQKGTSKEAQIGSFSPCGLDSNQMWELTHDGTLKNSYSGLCATMRAAQAYEGPHLIRAWVATGRRGEIYVAIFNSNHHESEVSMRIKDLGMVLSDRDFEGASCKCREEWSGKDFGVVKDTLSIKLDMHDVALFVLDCTFN